MEQLKEIYATYVENAKKADKKKSFFDGIFGFGSSVKEHPCHQEFFDAVTGWCEDLAQSAPAAQQAEEAVRYILETPEAYKERLPYWYMFASHGAARPLVAFVSPQFAAQMVTWYESHYSRRDRMPVQQELFDLLKKRAKA